MLLSLHGITKSFPGVLANDRVDLTVHKGEIHALLGENGAGKSTLMKILYGFYRADAGEIRLRGQNVRIRSPHDARRFRIGMVFQDFILIPALTVAENIALFLPDQPFILDKSGMVGRIREVSEQYGLQVDPAAPVWRLSVGERQKVEVLKLLLADAEILILDEPTRSLAPHEIEGLFGVFENLRRDGYAVLFITHKLREVLACSDRITVMRSGRVAGSLQRGHATEGGLVSLMFGEQVVESARGRGVRQEGEASPLLELRQVSSRAEGRGVALEGIDLAVRSGEIVGVAGVSGNGQRELGDVVLGLLRCSGGSKWLWADEATGWSVARVRESGVAFIPEEPLAMAAFPGMTVLENMAIGLIGKYTRWGGLAVDWAAAREDLERSLERLQFPAPPIQAAMRTLSGGNVQRVVLAREMGRNPRLIVAFYPTRGLDVRSAVAAREVMSEARDRGAGLLLISEDLGELFSLSDRIVVLFRGRIVGTGTPEEMSMQEVGLLMTGSRWEGGHCG